MFNLWHSKLRLQLPRSVPINGFFTLKSGGLINFVWSLAILCPAEFRSGGTWAERRGPRLVVCLIGTRHVSLTKWFVLCGGELVMLQAMKEEPPLAAKCKDKFLIQSTTITPEKETLSLTDIVSPSSLPFLATCHSLTDIWTSLLVSRNVSVYVMTT